MNNFLHADLDVSGITIACHVPIGTGSPYHRDRPHFGVAFFPGGEKKYSFASGHAFAARMNDIVFFPQGSTYSITVTEPGECWAINFDLRTDVPLSPFVLHMKNDALLKRFVLAKEVWLSRKPGFVMKCKAELYNILYAMQAEGLSAYLPSDKESMIRPAVDFIHANYTAEGLRIDTLASMCGITPEYFRKLFRAFHGTSPLAYINALRINRAKELLAAGLYSVTEAAILSGYTDPSYFSKEFKKETGASPSEYAKKARQG